MPAHYCINPLDPYAEQEVLVTYDGTAPHAALRSAVEADGFDLLPDLSAECVRILQLEIAASRGRIPPHAWTPLAADGGAAVRS